MFLPTTNEKQDNIPADAGHFLRTETDSTDFKNENLTIKISRNKAQKLYFFKTIFQKILKQTNQSNKISTADNIGQRINSNQIRKNCWLTRYKRSK